MHQNDNLPTTTQNADLLRDGFCATPISAMEWLEMANNARRRAQAKTGYARKVWAEAARLAYEKSRLARLLAS
jgi:hypothetical protein